jgi:UDP-glucuronate 4-epimerase
MFLVTGAAGFIGFNVALRLLNDGHRVLGIDSINSSYDPALKFERLHVLRRKPGFSFVEGDITQKLAVLATTKNAWQIDTVIHLAAQASVGESMDDPFKCVDSNVVGFMHVLEFCRNLDVSHLIYASTSAVYGETNPLPWSTNQSVDHPVSLYAATKKADELMANVYSNAYGLRTTGLRFFTVYGPNGRPDMAIFKFTRALFRDEPVTLFNHGNMSRDFTYVDDIVDGILKTTTLTSLDRRCRVYNLGSGQATMLGDLVVMLEELTHKKGLIKLADKPVSDLQHSLADVEPMLVDFGWAPRVDIRQGLANFVQWYAQFRVLPGNEKY